MKIASVIASACLVLAVPLSAAEPDPGVPAVAEIEKIEVKPVAFEKAERGKPIEIKSKEAAAEFFDEKALSKLTESADFEKQVVLVFAWKGSGQDELLSRVAESYPEQVYFELKPGRTRDLRPHVRVYALRSNVTWKAK